MKQEIILPMGTKFGRLEVIGPSTRRLVGGKLRLLYPVRCSCGSGRTWYVLKQNLTRGTVTSCGCKVKEWGAKMRAQTAASTVCQVRECTESIASLRYCVKHYRFHNMKSRACTSKKRSPKFAELETLVPEDMICPPCGRQMNWLYEDGRSTVITLQHDRSGKIRMLCMACNVRHAKNSGDSFYDLKPDEKRCPLCKKIKHYSEFVRNKGKGWKGTTGACRPCHNERSQQWRKNNRARYLKAHRKAEQRRRDQAKVDKYIDTMDAVL